MTSRDPRVVSAALLLACLISAGGAEAQSHACDPAAPLLGTAGPELCVVVYDNALPTKNIEYFRDSSFPMSLTTTGLPGPMTIGEYTIELEAVATFAPLERAIQLEGTVTRTSPGTTRLTIQAQAGWGPLIDAGFLTLDIAGVATGTSQVLVGGAVGVPVGTVPAEDLMYRGSPQTITVANYDAAGFGQTLTHEYQPALVGAAAVSLIVDFHINVPGVEIEIPAGVSLRDKDAPPPDDGDGSGKAKPHFECYSVGRPEGQRQRTYSASPHEEDEIFVVLEDQFGFVETPLAEPTRICTPVSKNGEPVPDPELHLVCYKMLGGHDPNEPVLTTNQFGEATLVVRQSKELCVPSTKKRLQEQKEQEQKEQEQKQAQEGAG